MQPTKDNFNAISSEYILGTHIPGVSIKYAKGLSEILNPILINQT